MRQRYLGAAMTVISDGELHAMRRIQRERVGDVPAVHRARRAWQRIRIGLVKTWADNAASSTLRAASYVPCQDSIHTTRRRPLEIKSEEGPNAMIVQRWEGSPEKFNR